ncbi:hypothetical protein FG379_002071 [Cryptosporidium bovis]|uniref:uncharacterized protein n=1 Tax=Cryptosporidium bovis TaxID=310047 RepID=UPI00351A583B|nr:hypothetical protein FG379_002071 [Cryptosporidium bovis]
MCDYGVLLSQIENTIENNEYNEYAFGTVNQNSVDLFDEDFIRTVAIKKMLHCLSTILENSKFSPSFEKKYSSRVKILILKLEKKLPLEPKSDDPKENILKQSENVDVGTDHKDFGVDSNTLENDKLTLSQIGNSDEEQNSAAKQSHNNYMDDINNQVKLTEEINEELKEDLAVLAEEMKKSALRFGELMKSEKKVSFLAFNTFFCYLIHLFSVTFRFYPS